MKQLFTLLCIALLCSCGASKKTTNKTETNTDSTGTKSSLVVDVKKKEANRNTTSQATEKTQTEGSYKKTTTTVREYYSDEFEFEGSDETRSSTLEHVEVVAAKPSAKKPGLKMKETTTTVEEGIQKQIKDAAMLEEKSGKIAGVDSSARDEKQGSQVSTNQETKGSNRANITLLPWWAILLLIIGLALFIGIKTLK